MRFALIPFSCVLLIETFVQKPGRFTPFVDLFGDTERVREVTVLFHHNFQVKSI